MQILFSTILQIFIHTEDIVLGVLFYSLIPALIGVIIHFLISLFSNKPITKNHFFTFIFIYILSILIFIIFLLSLI